MGTIELRTQETTQKFAAFLETPGGKDAVKQYIADRQQAPSAPAATGALDTMDSRPTLDVSNILQNLRNVRPFICSYTSYCTSSWSIGLLWHALSHHEATCGPGGGRPRRSRIDAGMC